MSFLGADVWFSDQYLTHIQSINQLSLIHYILHIRIRLTITRYQLWFNVIKLISVSEQYAGNRAEIVFPIHVEAYDCEL